MNPTFLRLMTLPLYFNHFPFAFQLSIGEASIGSMAIDFAIDLKRVPL